MTLPDNGENDDAPEEEEKEADAALLGTAGRLDVLTARLLLLLLLLLIPPLPLLSLLPLLVLVLLGLLLGPWLLKPRRGEKRKNGLRVPPSVELLLRLSAPLLKLFPFTSFWVRCSLLLAAAYAAFPLAASASNRALLWCCKK